jgi:hypothetical protein
MKNKVKHSKRVIGAPNSNKDRILGAPNNAKEWVIGHPIH